MAFIHFCPRFVSVTYSWEEKKKERKRRENRRKINKTQKQQCSGTEQTSLLFCHGLNDCFILIGWKLSMHFSQQDTAILQPSYHCFKKNELAMFEQSTPAIHRKNNVQRAGEYVLVSLHAVKALTRFCSPYKKPV